jgi:hypothetical protein
VHRRDVLGPAEQLDEPERSTRSEPGRASISSARPWRAGRRSDTSGCAVAPRFRQRLDRGRGFEEINASSRAALSASRPRASGADSADMIWASAQPRASFDTPSAKSPSR